MRGVDGRTGLELSFADSSSHLKPLAEQLKDFTVDPINLAAMIFEAHAVGASGSGGFSVATTAAD